MHFLDVPPPTHRLANSCRTVHILNSKMAFSTHFGRWPEYNECSNVLNGSGRVFLKRNFKHRPQKICAPNRVIRVTPSRVRHKKAVVKNYYHSITKIVTSNQYWVSHLSAGIQYTLELTLPPSHDPPPPPPPPPFHMNRRGGVQ